jgi:hypothetical protein
MRRDLCMFHGITTALLAAIALGTDGAGDTAPRRSSPPARADLGADLLRLGITARSQGERNTCSLFAITALATLEAARGRPPPAPRLSEEFLVWAANEATGLRGDQAMFYEAVHGLQVLGICSEGRMPYTKGERGGGRPSPEALAEAGALSRRWRVHWIKRWDVK